MTGGLYRVGLPCVVHMGGHSENLLSSRLGILTNILYFFCNTPLASYVGGNAALRVKIFVRSQRVFGGWVNPVMGRASRNGIGGVMVFARKLEHGLSGAKLQRQQTTWEVVWAEILSVSVSWQPCVSMKKRDCCCGLNCNYWIAGLIEDILSVVFIVGVETLSFPLLYLLTIASVLWTDIRVIRLWMVCLLCVHVSDFVQIASNFEPIWYSATMNLSPCNPLRASLFSVLVSVISLWFSYRRCASKIQLTGSVFVDEVTQVKRWSVPLVRLLEQLPSIIPLLVRPASPFITHETILTYGDGGCCISWR